MFAELMEYTKLRTSSCSPIAPTRTLYIYHRTASTNNYRSYIAPRDRGRMSPGWPRYTSQPSEEQRFA